MVLLHEVLEKDSAISIEEVRREFSEEITHVILDVTELNKIKLELDDLALKYL